MGCKHEGDSKCVTNGNNVETIPKEFIQKYLQYDKYSTFHTFLFSLYQLFEGNSNYDTPELRNVEPLLTRFIRIYPERATPAGMGLRLELLGCEIEATVPPTTLVPNTTPSDECDDDQASCHSGTGDDYDMTGANIALMRLPSIIPLATSWVTLIDATKTFQMSSLSTADLISHSCHDGHSGDCSEIAQYSSNIIIRRVMKYDLVTHLMFSFFKSSVDFLGFACDFGWASDPSFCSWTSEDTGSRWQIQSSGTPTLNTGPNMDHTGGSGNFIYTLATGPQETEVARLVSPVVNSPDSDLCMSFWYHMFGPHIGMLHIKQRKQTVDGPADILLWTVSGHQGNRWREGRVLVPRTTKPYQVIIEGLVERKSWGDIAVDDIKVLSGVSMTDCKDPDVPTEPMLPEDRFNEIIEEITDYPDIVESNEISGPGNMLKTLDPILITIIAMSALGVFLGAICGVVLYCACSHGGMSDRNLSALENYNFELVDGVKLKKDKLNVQNSYSEA
ncbi:LOW QUALITY PROTEIN: neuropilin-1a-like [Thalassophryne amazonica]|uniref:LOW QUALITY PROTEIN: neuropilin-1a-like n=1 Tax=Thalassophryne amazonica TaxID=390379 RepID=UPI0014709F0F|nr:LOW QUALITY PROTEIN: neuropilin-1a-like [Thalassophryne amazonica]